MDVMKSIDELFQKTDGKSYQRWFGEYLDASETNAASQWSYGKLGFFCFVDLEALK